MNFEAARSVRDLPPNTVSHLRTTVNITSFPDALTELVQNALDAGARQIDCWINLDSWNLRVSDDGMGIGKEGMRTVGERYASSKASDALSLSKLRTYGFRGEALASLAGTSLLSITSRQALESTTHHKIIKGGRVLSNGQSNRLARLGKGTTVEVRDLFYNVPVRRPAHLSSNAFPHTASPFLTSTDTKPDHTSTLSACRKVIELAALSVRAGNADRGIGYTLTLESDDPSKERCKRLMTVPKATSSLDAFKSLFGRALILPPDVEEIHALAKGGEMKIEGFISFADHVSKAHQYIVVNGFSLKRCDLHKVVEQRFGRTSFGRTQIVNGEEAQMSRIRQSPRRMDLKPVYVLHLTIAPATVDMTIEPRKRTMGFESWSTVERFLAAVTDDMLAKHGFKEERSIQSREGTASPSKNPTVRTTPSKSRSKAATSISREMSSEASTTHRPDGSSGRKLQMVTTEATSPKAPSSNITQTTSNLAPGTLEKDSWAEWLNQVVMKPHTAKQLDVRIPAVVPADPETEQPVSAPHAHRLNACMLHETESLETAGASMAIKAADLRDARVLGQVDCKFICCVVADRSLQGERHNRNGTVVLLDQHAADERIRVEKYRGQIGRDFLADGVEGVDLHEDPHLILLSSRELDWLRGMPIRADLLRRWGFGIAFDSQEATPSDGEYLTDKGDFAHVRVTSVPKILAKRLGKQGVKDVKRILQDFISLHEAQGIGGLLSLIQKPDQGVAAGVLRWCPSRMLELINSKACRGAIMFNDPLSLDQCERMVQDLAGTDFPFMCAHGRPSLIPLVRYGDRDEGATQRRLDWKMIRL